jgi:hypothetical protein
MSRLQTPRSIVKAMVRGEAPARPLLMPLMFSLGARLESLPLRDFRSNPTRIANALKQIRSVLKPDGLTCYFDPCLEPKTLGFNCVEDEYGFGNIESPCPEDVDALRERLESPNFPTTSGPLNVACEALSRLKIMMLDEPALMVAINGPLALAAQLSGTESGEIYAVFGAEVVLSVARALAEAGADVVVLKERWPSLMSHEAVRRWIDSVEPIANLLLFYEALPVLLLDGPGASWENLALLANELPHCVLIPLPTDSRAEVPRLSRRLNGIALPASIFENEQLKHGSPSPAFTNLTTDLALALVTSSEDIPFTVDPKQVALVLQQIRSHLSPGRQ